MCWHSSMGARSVYGYYFICILLRGRGSAFCYPGHTVLCSFLYLYVFVCVSACRCVDVVVSLLITICFSLTVWSGKAPRPAAHNTLFWSPGSTVCLAPQWGRSCPDASPSSETWTFLRKRQERIFRYFILPIKLFVYIRFRVKLILLVYFFNLVRFHRAQIKIN